MINAAFKKHGLALFAWAVAIALSGCAAPPNTPGTGVGAAYTPVIDTAGADTSRYMVDLGECRRLAGSIDVQRETMNGAIGGMVAGALISAMLSGGRQTTIDSASIGGFTGIGAAGVDAERRSKAMVINCMAGRGYRTLEVAPMIAAYPTPRTIPTATPPSNSNSTTTTTTTAAPAAAPMPAPTGPVQVIAAAPSAPTRMQIGDNSHQVERMADVKFCNQAPTAYLAGKGAGVETYTVACSGGDVLTVRCEMSACRVLR